MTKKVIVFFFLSTLGVQSIANEFYQFTFLLSPSFETLNLRSKFYRGLNGYKLSYNFGAEYKHFIDPSMSLSAGLEFQNKGFRNVLGDAGHEAEGVFTKSALVVSAYYISVPTNINFHVSLGDKSRLVFTTGFTNGFLVHQVQEGKRISEDAENQISLSGEEITDKRTPINLFKTHYFGWNFGVGFVKYIYSKMVLEVQPMYYRQLNQAVRDDAPLATTDELIKPKFDSFAFQFKLGYYFNRQISQSKKQF